MATAVDGDSMPPVETPGPLYWWKPSKFDGSKDGSFEGYQMGGMEEMIFGGITYYDSRNPSEYTMAKFGEENRIIYCRDGYIARLVNNRSEHFDGPRDVRVWGADAMKGVKALWQAIIAGKAVKEPSLRNYDSSEIIVGFTRYSTDVSWGTELTIQVKLNADGKDFSVNKTCPDMGDKTKWVVFTIEGDPTEY
ncbi:hypothetical protein ABW19_dt0202284 [Dactylella cylindrospora]|nr:hypothetical protein ABW19_dt0202284 [Dactylella cylindrospora]